jgi:hypothetical protein
LSVPKKYFAIVSLMIAPLAVFHPRDAPRRGGAHVGQLRELFLELLKEEQGSLARVAVQRRIERETEQLVGLEAGIERLQVVEAAGEEAGAGEEQHRQPHLGDDEPLAEACVPGAADDAARFVLERRDQRRAGGLQRRCEAEEQRRQERAAKGEERDARVRRGRQRLRSGVERQHLQQQGPRPPGEGQADGRAGSGQHEALDQPLPHDRVAAGAEREANRHLLLARGAARQQQVGDVRARDQQHQTDHAHQHENRRRELLTQIGSSFLARAQEQVLADEALAEALRRVGDLLELLLVDLPVDHVHRRFRLLRRHARLQPRHDRQPAAAAVLQVVPGRRHLRLHHHRHEHVGAFADDDAVEARRRDADDRHRLAVERHAAVEDRRVAIEAPRPVAVGEDDHRMSAWRAVVVLREGAADVRAHAEDVEVVAGDQLAVDAFGLAVGDERERRREAREDAVEHGILIAEVAIHRIREGALVESASLERARAVEDHEPLGRGDGKKPQEDLVGQRKDRGVGADAEGERQHDDHGERRRFDEGADGVAEVLGQAHGSEYFRSLSAVSTKTFVEPRFDRKRRISAGLGSTRYSVT